MVTLSPDFVPARLVGVMLDADNPLKFDFLVSHGQSQESSELEAETSRMIRYFFAAVTVSEDDFWVNLSPYEKDRVIAEAFGQTEMGRDFLAQDYLLKELSSSMMHPDEKLGASFWTNLYEKAYREYGNTDIPIDSVSIDTHGYI